MTQGQTFNAALDEALCWTAVCTRDAKQDGRFVFAVLTTGIYCRPGCSARTAKRENVRFFALPVQAQAAGYRACKRCQPDLAMDAMAKLAQVANYIREHAEQSLTLAELARRAELSTSHFQRRFSAVFGVSPKLLQDQARSEKFKRALKLGADVTTAGVDAGYGSSSRVHQHSARHLGMSPSVYRAAGKGEMIYFAYRQTVLGVMLMAATNKGICFVQFGESLEILQAQLQSEFSGAELIASTAQSAPALDAWIEALNAHLSTHAPAPELPLDLRGTAFQIRVWRFLLGIESGQVLSYRELAEGISAGKAVRAVASACARNRVAVLVPCHRVLRGDGSLGGYRWGLERKRALLAAEQGANSA